MSMDTTAPAVKNRTGTSAGRCYGLIVDFVSDSDSVYDHDHDHDHDHDYVRTISTFFARALSVLRPR
jgi:hypothetical protein